MKAKLSFDETKRLVEFYFSNAKSPSRAMRAFNAWALTNNFPIRLTVKNVVDAMKRFENASFLKATRPHRYKKTTDEEILSGVLSSLFQQTDSSIRKCASDMNLSVGTTHAIARHVEL